MRVVCVFCREELRAGPEGEVSHGACEPCAAGRMFAVSPVEAVRFWIGKHPEDVAALAVAVLAGCFLVWWLFYGAPPCAP